MNRPVILCTYCGKRIISTRPADVKCCSKACRYAIQYGHIEQRFWSKVQKSDGCWVWTGVRNADGYGEFVWNGKHMAHRFAYNLLRGPIPEGLFACHHCDNPPCVNPDHIFIGTNQDNQNDSKWKNRRAVGAEWSKNYGHIDWSGTKNPRSKLTEDQIRAILDGHRSGKVPRVLAEEFGVCRTSIRNVLDGFTYSEITERLKRDDCHATHERLRAAAEARANNEGRSR